MARPCSAFSAILFTLLQFMVVRSMPQLGGQTGNTHRNTRRLLQAQVFAASPVSQPQTSTKDGNGNGNSGAELLRFTTPVSHATTVADLGAHVVSCPDGTVLNGFRLVVIQDPAEAAANGTTAGANNPTTQNHAVVVEYSCLRVPLTANCSASAARIYHSGKAANTRFPVTSNLALADLSPNVGFTGSYNREMLMGFRIYVNTSGEGAAGGRPVLVAQYRKCQLPPPEGTVWSATFAVRDADWDPVYGADITELAAHPVGCKPNEGMREWSLDNWYSSWNRQTINKFTALCVALGPPVPLSTLGLSTPQLYTRASSSYDAPYLPVPLPQPSGRPLPATGYVLAPLNTSLVAQQQQQEDQPQNTQGLVAVCSEAFTAASGAPSQLCRSLGFGQGRVATWMPRVYSETRPFVLYGLSCDGDGPAASCTAVPSYDGSCTVAAVTCEPASPPPSPAPPRPPPPPQPPSAPPPLPPGTAPGRCECATGPSTCPRQECTQRWRNEPRYCTCFQLTGDPFCFGVQLCGYDYVPDGLECRTASVNTCAEYPFNWLRCLSLAPWCVWVPPGETWAPPQLEYRLVGGEVATEGRLEVRLGGEWGTVCDDLFTNASAAVACRAMGLPYSAAEAVQSAAYGSGSGAILLDDVQCDGQEDGLLACTFRTPFGTSNCQHNEDVGVRCRGHPWDGGAGGGGGGGGKDVPAAGIQPASSPIPVPPGPRNPAVLPPQDSGPVPTPLNNNNTISPVNQTFWQPPTSVPGTAPSAPPNGQQAPHPGTPPTPPPPLVPSSPVPVQDQGAPPPLATPPSPPTNDPAPPPAQASLPVPLPVATYPAYSHPTAPGYYGPTYVIRPPPHQQPGSSGPAAYPSPPAGSYPPHHAPSPLGHPRAGSNTHQQAEEGGIQD